MEAAAVQLNYKLKCIKIENKVGNSNLHNLISHIQTALFQHHYLLDLKFHRTCLLIIIYSASCFIR
uniref:Putative ovule protein n=1 Tax=Solanum chacoense TaxID=4108 RepID=A0A0V0HDR7_SOLCH